MREVTLQEMLAARDRRAEAQRRLLAEQASAVISFTMNIPGPVKNSPTIRRAFDEGLRLLVRSLDAAGITRTSAEILHAVTGNEFLCAAGTSAEAVKAICTRIEEESPLGRLFDMDVIAPDGSKLARKEERRCLVCGAAGRGCASRRLHSLAELQGAVRKLLTEGLLAADAARADDLATEALLREVATTPKPGLVDRENNGAHRDMTVETFEKSAEALRGYWRDCFLIGARTAQLPPAEAFSVMRARGLEAEKKMFAATGGVNTHKGAVFTLGTVCGALGRLWRAEERCADPAGIAAVCAALCTEAVAADFAALDKCAAAQTAGEELYLTSGLRGIRGEVAAGLPSVLQTGLPVLEACLSEGMSRNDAGVIALLHLIARGEDTNMIRRGGAALAAETARRMKETLGKDSRPSMDRVREWDAFFIQNRLSPGGCADLLAVSLFMHDWRLPAQE